jgi:hypothetical protein
VEFQRFDAVTLPSEQIPLRFKRCILATRVLVSIVNQQNSLWQRSVVGS